jgi:hypothetical protein
MREESTWCVTRSRTSRRSPFQAQARTGIWHSTFPLMFSDLFLDWHAVRLPFTDKSSNVFLFFGLPPQPNSSGHPCPPFKLVVLDEADSMTIDAQSALRRTMETYTRVTRFCIICNYVSRYVGKVVLEGPNILPWLPARRRSASYIRTR